MIEDNNGESPMEDSTRKAAEINIEEERRKRGGEKSRMDREEKTR